MGKLKIKTLGDEVAEAEAIKKIKEKKEQKKLSKGSGVVSMSPTEEELAVVDQKTEVIEAKEEAKDPTSPSASDRPSRDGKASRGKKEKFLKNKKAARSKSYAKVLAQVDRTKVYTLAEALTLLPSLSRGKFDETVELHINTLEQGVSASVTLPHGTGKQIKVVIANDALLAEIEKGKINFDILLAHPSMMPKLAKVAKVLGPKGLMPNPKNGTVTQNPEEAAKKYEGGLMNVKTEAKSPIIHLTVGKVSFGDKKLSENIATVLGVIPASKIRNVTLKSTMSPGIKVQL